MDGVHWSAIRSVMDAINQKTLNPAKDAKASHSEQKEIPSHVWRAVLLVPLQRDASASVTKVTEYQQWMIKSVVSNASQGP